MIGAELTGDRRIGRYVLGERIGKGGMAEVFIGHAIGARGFRKPVAIKRLISNRANDLASIERLIEEAKLLVGLQHGNVVSVLDLVCEGDDVFVVMEYVDGPSVRQLVRYGERLSLGIASYVVHAAAVGLDYAHAQAIVHADVSPSNLLLMRTGEVRVADFGIARRADGTSGEGFVEGKWSYMPPEQARGEVLTPKADVFALGIVLYELVSGVRPIPSASCADPADIAPLHVVAPDAPRTLSALCRRCLAEAPAARPTMAELRDALTELRFTERWREGARELSTLIREAAVPAPRMPHSVATSLVAIDPEQIARTAEPKMIATGTVHGRSVVAPLPERLTEPMSAPRLSDVLRALEPSQLRFPVDAAPVKPSSEPASDDITASKRVESPSISFSISVSEPISRSEPARPSLFSLAAMPAPALAAEVIRPTTNRSRLVWGLAVCAIAGASAAWIGYSEIRIGEQPRVHHHVTAPTDVLAIAPPAPEPPEPMMVVEPIEPTPAAPVASEPQTESAYRPPVVRPAIVELRRQKRTVAKPRAVEAPPVIAAEPAPAPTVDIPPQQTAAALVTTGTELFLASKLVEAREAFEGALAIDPNNAFAHRGLGFIYQRTGAAGKAIAELRSYLALRPAAHDTAAIEARIANLGGDE